VGDEERSLSGRAVARSAWPEMRRLPVQSIRPRPDQPRRRIDPRGLEELTRSVGVHGVLQPIRVRRCGEDEYEIVAGERRWRAARSAGLQDIPAIVVEADDDRAYVEALIENVQREELNAVDRAHALTRLRAGLGLRSWQEVGEVVGITRQHIHNLLNVTRLPEPMRDDIRAGSLTEKHARALMRLQPHPPLQRLLWERIHTEHLSGRAAEEAARTMGAPLEPRAAGTAPERGLGLSALVEATIAALGAARPEEVGAAAAGLAALHRRLGEVLGQERPAPV
jgi:ParB family transcriptional regulator, chromosome partitioning protein